MRTSKSSRRCVAVSKEPARSDGHAIGCHWYPKAKPSECNCGVLSSAGPQSRNGQEQLTTDLSRGAGTESPAATAPPLLPLSKSLQKDMACEAMFVAKHIQHVPDFESEAARRGTEIHNAISVYVRHLCVTLQETDYDFLRNLAGHLGPEAKEIIERFTENFIFDPEKVLYVEKRLSLDVDFNPVEPGSEESVYEGTPDLVCMDSETECRIDDWKSQFAIAADADSFEAKFYSLLIFCTNPGLEKVSFTLNFVRYGSACRSANFTRADVPELKQIAQRERSREYSLYAAYRNRELGYDVPAITAAPGKQCTYCPIVALCPLSKVNPYTQLTPEQRLAHTVWLKEALAHNTAILRDVVLEHGPIECGDDAGGRLRAEFRPKTIRSYPIAQTLPILNSWRQSHPGDGYMIDGLCVSGLSSPLKARKREQLAQQLSAVAEVRCQTDFRVGIAKEESDE